MPSSSSPDRAVDAIDPSASCTRLSGVGPKLAERLAALGIHAIGDLLLHRPLRYEDRTRVTPISELTAERASVVVARVEDAQIHYGRRRSLRVRVADDSGDLGLRFFHFSPAQQARLAPGTWLRIFGEARGFGAMLEMAHPETEVMADRATGLAITPRLVAVYPTTAGLGQPRLRGLIDQARALLDRPGFWIEALPNDMDAAGLMSSADALRLIHDPPANTALEALISGEHPAVGRLAFEELLAHQISLRARRKTIRRETAPALGDAGRGLRPLFDQLGFSPTSAQRRVIGEILADLAGAHPMLRLLQGDVGSGKTVVAAAALLTAVENNWQAALMAPTELLAEQHGATLARWLEPLGVPVWLVTGKRSRDSTVVDAIAAGTPGVAVGTHALFERRLSFGRLGLSIIDEQHRFGVDQRLALKHQAANASITPHQLIMTATPIPRTLAMSAYADLDTSTIDELPPGRTPVTTAVIANSRRDDVIDRIGRAVADGRQVYWVCTLIEDSNKLEAQAAEAAAEALREVLPDVRVGLAHGRLRAADKQAVMTDFAEARIDVLVATTVIEVGVDVPNASLMVIENAERLGLAQLHQLRGRVGRGSIASHCLLLYQPPLSDNARQRLRALRATTDGFAIARADLDLRGPGEVLGTRQTGVANFRIADLTRDQALAESAARQADSVLDYHPREAERLRLRWVAGASDYVAV